MQNDWIEPQLKEILARIAAAAEAAGRKAAEVKLVAVSKTFPPEDIRQAYDAGQKVFGENKVQELEGKVPVLPNDIEWHLIGSLQSNKAGKAVALASWIHSVDSEKLLRRIDRLAGEAGKKINILLEINVSGEESKSGIRGAEEAMRAARIAAELPNVSFKGLMTMAPLEAKGAALSKFFADLRELRNRMEKELSIKLPELSMGMSGDFEAAIKEGATMVRIGTAIFGKRTYKVN